MQAEAQVQPEMSIQRQSIESNEQKPRRGGKRPGARRKPNQANILLNGTSRATLLQALENVDPQLVAAKITKLSGKTNARLASAVAFPPHNVQRPYRANSLPQYAILWYFLLIPKRF